MSGFELADPARTTQEQIVSTSQHGTILDFGLGNGLCAVDAALIGEVCRGRSGELGAGGIAIANATVDGVLDLRSLRLDVPLAFFGCRFTGPITMEGARLHQLTVADGSVLEVSDRHNIGDSSIAGLLGNGVTIARDLNLSGTRVYGVHRSTASTSKSSAIWLTEAEIGGRLLCVGTHINTAADRAIQADRTHIAGDVRLIHDFRANREVRFLASRFGGSLDLTGARLIPTSGRALDMSEATVDGSMFILDDRDTGRSAVITGRVEAAGATIRGRLFIRDSYVGIDRVGGSREDYDVGHAAPAEVIHAPRLNVGGEVIVEGDCYVRGTLNLVGSELRGGLRIAPSVILDSCGTTALDISNATVGLDIDACGARVWGSIRLDGVAIDGSLRLDRTEVRRAGGSYSIDAVRARIAGDVSIAGLVTRDGGVRFRGAEIGGIFDAEGARISNPQGKSVNLHQARIGGNLRLCTGFRSTGLVVLNRAIVDGRLRCDQGSFRWVGPPVPEFNLVGASIEAISATFRSGIGLHFADVYGPVDFTDAQTPVLADDPTVDWPDGSLITGFAYARFAPGENRRERGEWSVRDRTEWLTRLAFNDVDPWSRASHAYALRGDIEGAEQLLVAQRTSARRARGAGGHGLAGVAHWLRELMLGLTVAYGYRPGRALLLMAGLVAVVAAPLSQPTWRDSMRAVNPRGEVYSPSGPLDLDRSLSNGEIDSASEVAAATGDLCGNGEVRCFNALIYAIDVVVPIMDLGQRSAWYPNREAHSGRQLSWLFAIATVLGWAASTVFVLSFTRLGRGGSLQPGG